MDRNRLQWRARSWIGTSRKWTIRLKHAGKRNHRRQRGEAWNEQKDKNDGGVGSEQASGGRKYRIITGKKAMNRKGGENNYHNKGRRTANDGGREGQRIVQQENHRRKKKIKTVNEKMT
jgi:hypothetical protein